MFIETPIDMNNTEILRSRPEERTPIITGFLSNEIPLQVMTQEGMIIEAGKNQYI